MTADEIGAALRAASQDTEPLRERIAELEAAVLAGKTLLHPTNDDTEEVWQILDRAYHGNKGAAMPMGSNDQIRQHAERAVAARADWLEKTLSDLMASGIHRDLIEVQEHPEHRTVVVVAGVPRAQWTFGLTTDK